jgi:hypothetical protein
MSGKHRRLAQALVLLFMWVVYVGVFVFFFFVSFDIFTEIYSYVTSVFFAVTASFFGVYGFLVYRRVMQMPLRGPAVTARVKRVAATSAVITFAFVVRAILNAALPSLQAVLSDTQSWIL